MLPQNFAELFKNIDTSDLENVIRTLFNPTVFFSKSIDYAHLIEQISYTFTELARNFIVEVLELKDLEFRNSDYRKSKYYVKQTRHIFISTKDYVYLDAKSTITQFIQWLLNYMPIKIP